MINYLAPDIGRGRLLWRTEGSWPGTLDSSNRTWQGPSHLQTAWARRIVAPPSGEGSLPCWDWAGRSSRTWQGSASLRQSWPCVVGSWKLQWISISCMIIDQQSFIALIMAMTGCWSFMITYLMSLSCHHETSHDPTCAGDPLWSGEGWRGFSGCLAPSSDDVDEKTLPKKFKPSNASPHISGKEKLPRRSCLVRSPSSCSGCPLRASSLA